MKNKNRLSAIIVLFFMTVFFVVCSTSCSGIGVCFHSWGSWTVTKNSTCIETGIRERTCSKCGKVKTEIIELSEHTIVEEGRDCTKDAICAICGKVAIPAKEAHSGGTATCQSKAICSECGMEYGEIGTHVPEEDDGDCTTPIKCIYCDLVMTPADDAHTGGTATCQRKAVCDKCGMEYGELAEHVIENDDGDCTTQEVCSVCREVVVPAKEAHSGGTANCLHKAVCSDCGMEYGELGDHDGEIIWVKRIDTHYQVYSCCYEEVSSPEPHTIVDGACSVCGYNPAIKVTSTEVSPGDTQVKVSLSIKDNPGIAGLTITVQYNSDTFELKQAESGEALDALNFTAPATLKSGSTFLWDGVNVADEDIKDGEFLILTFDVSASALEGEYSILVSVTAYDNDLKPLTLIITSGKITISDAISN